LSSADKRRLAAIRNYERNLCPKRHSAMTTTPWQDHTYELEELHGSNNEKVMISHLDSCTHKQQCLYLTCLSISKKTQIFDSICHSSSTSFAPLKLSSTHPQPLSLHINKNRINIKDKPASSKLKLNSTQALLPLPFQTPYLNLNINPFNECGYLRKERRYRIVYNAAVSYRI
jgi:hypothetical protein